MTKYTGIDYGTANTECRNGQDRNSPGFPGGGVGGSVSVFEWSSSSLSSSSQSLWIRFGRARGMNWFRYTGEEKGAD
jgi:hypothetical protein